MPNFRRRRHPELVPVAPREPSRTSSLSTGNLSDRKNIVKKQPLSSLSKSHRTTAATRRKSPQAAIVPIRGSHTVTRELPDVAVTAPPPIKSVVRTPASITGPLVAVTNSTTPIKTKTTATTNNQDASRNQDLYNSTATADHSDQIFDISRKSDLLLDELTRIIDETSISSSQTSSPVNMRMSSTPDPTVTDSDAANTSYVPNDTNVSNEYDTAQSITIVADTDDSSAFEEPSDESSPTHILPPMYKPKVDDDMLALLASEEEKKRTEKEKALRDELRREEEEREDRRRIMENIMKKITGRASLPEQVDTSTNGLSNTTASADHVETINT